MAFTTSAAIFFFFSHFPLSHVSCLEKQNKTFMNFFLCCFVQHPDFRRRVKMRFETSSTGRCQGWNRNQKCIELFYTISVLIHSPPFFYEKIQFFLSPFCTQFHHRRLVEEDKIKTNFKFSFLFCQFRRHSIPHNFIFLFQLAQKLASLQQRHQQHWYVIKLSFYFATCKIAEILFDLVLLFTKKYENWGVMWSWWRMAAEKCSLNSCLLDIRCGARGGNKGKKKISKIQNFSRTCKNPPTTSHRMEWKTCMK